jgi:hypothetical protein
MLSQKQRAQLVLAPDAERLPALALEPVIDAVRNSSGSWIATQGFSQVWLVAPDSRLTWRLDV